MNGQDLKRVSAVIITYDEEENIREALESVKWADEIVVVDAFSSDRTVQIARQYTDKVFQRRWHGYVDQKNYALDKASYNWVLSIDADERVSPELKAEILAWKKLHTAEAGYLIPRKAFFLGRWIKHTTWYPDYQLRLFDKTKGRWQGGRVHESVKVRGQVGRLRGELLHYTYRSASDYLERLDRYSLLAAQDYYDRGKRASFFALVFNPLLTFIKNYIVKQGFRDGYAGLVVSILAAISVFFKYVRLLELERSHKVDSYDLARPLSVMFIDSEPAWRGGQDQLLSLMRGLKRLGHQVSLVARPASPLAERATGAQIQVHHLRIRGELDPLAFLGLYRLLKTKRVDILHCNTPREILTATLASMLAGVPRRFISRRVNYRLRHSFSRLKYTFGINKIIAVSYAIKRDLIAEGIPEGMIEVVHEGIDIEEFDRTEAVPIEPRTSDVAHVGTVGHLSQEKGHEVLIEAAAQIARTFPQARFVIVGEGKLLRHLRRKAEGLGLKDKFIFTGFRSDAIGLIKSFDMFVLPSLSEGFPMVLLYAMAASLPVVASAVGGVPEIVEHGITGILVPPGDRKALAEAISDLLSRPEEARAMGKAGRLRLELEFDLQRKIARTLEVYKKSFSGS